MGILRKTYFGSLTNYKDPENPQTSQYDIIYPYTHKKAVYVNGDKKTLDKELDEILYKTGDSSDVTNIFTTAISRINLVTGEKISVSLGKITRWFSDLGGLAFKNEISKNDLAEELKKEMDSKIEKDAMPQFEIDENGHLIATYPSE